MVIEYNRASIFLGKFSDYVFTNEVLVKHNAGQLSLLNDVGSVEIQSNGEGRMYGSIDVYGSIRSHMDQKDNTGYSKIYLYDLNLDFDLWVGKQCGLIKCIERECPDSWAPYLNTEDCP